ncbi:MAG: hypothetical protein JWN77_1403 [Frankiales bacterium]|jgi:hypothetical protein|nr:hypothetical protein [Frankiales bacterium]
MQQDEDRQLARVEEELVREFASALTEQVVSEQLRGLVAEFAGAPVRTFVPVLAQRVARERLRALSVS